MASEGTLLKALLRERHLQEHRAFCREYERVARRVDPGMEHGYPSKATFYRWLSGDLRNLPYPGHCRVLEAMLPGWSAEDLFRSPVQARARKPPDPDDAKNRATNDIVSVGRFLDLRSLFLTRSEFTHQFAPDRLLDGAQDIHAVGLSLNLLCQHYGDRRIRSLINSGCTIKSLFLDPRGEAIKAREREEGYDKGLLASLTAFNIRILLRLRSQLPSEAQDRLLIHVYDEAPRFNITLVDRRTCVVQPYLPAVRGVDSPTLVIERDGENVLGLLDTFEQVVNALWERSSPVG